MGERCLLVDVDELLEVSHQIGGADDFLFRHQDKRMFWWIASLDLIFPDKVKIKSGRGRPKSYASFRVNKVREFIAQHDRDD